MWRNVGDGQIGGHWAGFKRGELNLFAKASVCGTAYRTYLYSIMGFRLQRIVGMTTKQIGGLYGFRPPHIIRIAIGLVAHFPMVLVGRSIPSEDDGTFGDVRHMEVGGFLAGGDIIDAHIIYMQVVVAIVCYLTLTIEGNHEVGALISGKVDGNIFPRGKNVIIHVGRARVVPFAEDGPGAAIVGRGQDDESVVRLLSRNGGLQGAIVLGQSQFEGELAVVLHGHYRCEQPIIDNIAPNVDSGMVIKHAIGGTESPTLVSRVRG